MATRYWVGGAGAWDGSSTTHWSASSGGAGGASAPTSNDAVIFNASSGGGTVTISLYNCYCASLTTTGFTGTLTSPYSYQCYVSGNVVLANGTASGGFRVYFTTNGAGATTGTLNSGTNSLGRVTVGDGFTATLASNLLIDAYGLLLLSGDTPVLNQGSYQIGSSSAYISAYLGNSAASSAVWNTGTGTSYINKIILYGSSITGSGTINYVPTYGPDAQGMDIYAKASGASISATLNVDGWFAIYFYNSNTFTFSGTVSITATGASQKVLKIVAPNSSPSTSVVFSSLNMNGTATSRGLILGGSTNSAINSFISYNSARPVVTFTSATGLNYCDFANINSGSSISPTSAGDGGNNTNITFTTPVTRYAISGGGRVWNSTASWSTSSGGAGGASIPLPQDTAIFNTSSGTGYWNTFAPYYFMAPTITATNFNADLRPPEGYAWISKSITPPATHDILLFNSTLYLVAGTYTLSKTYIGECQVANNANVTLANCSINGYLRFAYGTVTTTGDLFCRGIVGSEGYDTNAPITFNMGTSLSFYSYGAGLDFSGSNTKTFSGSPNLISTIGTNYGATLKIKGIPARTWGNVTLVDMGLVVYNSQTFISIDISNTSTITASNVYFETGKTYSVDSWKVYGNASQLTTITSHSNGSPTTSTHNLSFTGAGYASSGYTNISYSSASPANTWYAGTTSTNGGNNTGWLFVNAPTGSNNLFFGSNF